MYKARLDAIDPPCKVALQFKHIHFFFYTGYIWVKFVAGSQSSSGSELDPSGCSVLTIFCTCSFFLILVHIWWLSHFLPIFLSCRGNMQTTANIFRLKDLVSPIILCIYKTHTCLIIEEVHHRDHHVEQIFVAESCFMAPETHTGQPVGYIPWQWDIVSVCLQLRH